MIPVKAGIVGENRMDIVAGKPIFDIGDGFPTGTEDGLNWRINEQRVTGGRGQVRLFIPLYRKALPWTLEGRGAGSWGL